VNGHALAAPVARSRDGPPVSTRAVAYVLPAAAIAATGGAVYVTAVSRHAPNPVGHAVLTVVVCLSFVGTGLLARRRPPYARFGLLLAAVGLSSLLGALHDANGATAYTIGVLTSNLVFAVLVHALLAFPTGRLGTRLNAGLAIAAYADVLVLQAVAVLFDPLTRWHSDHPANLALVDSHAALATGLEELEAGIAAAIALAVVVVITRRARSATPAARRQYGPVLVGGKIALLSFSVGLVLAPLSSDAAVIGIGVGLLAALALPASFLAVLLHGRLSRAAVGELLVELREPVETPGLEDALRRTLGDPTLELASYCPELETYVDRFGAPVRLPQAADTQTSTPIFHHGEPVGVIIHDRSLRLRPELLDAVAAAAGFALANERVLDTVQRVEASNRALLDAIPDLMFRVGRDGTYLDVRADDQSGLVRPPEQLIGRNVRDVLPPRVADAVLACVASALDTGAMCAVEYELVIRGRLRSFESRMVPAGADEVVTIARDFTEQRLAEAEERRLTQEQGALRRVATLVAGDAPPDRVFQTVTEEACALLGIRSALLLRYEGDQSSSVVGKFGEPYDAFEVGQPIPLEPGAALTVLQTGAPARVDYTNLGGSIAESMRTLGFRASVGVPITVAGTTWGSLIAGLRDGETLPAETERRLSAFAELVALAVASAHARDELAASRRRIVQASDAERRRIERNLHDGAQQRLVALAMGLRLAKAKVRSAPEEAEELLELAGLDLAEGLTELRELAQGIHPAVLAERGLGPALEVLAARAPLPVALDVRLPSRLPEQVEAASYYVVSEALANVVKHADASSARVFAERSDGHVVVEIEDDGTGGATLEGGSGLGGLLDRVETLAGRLDVFSGEGRGTRVRAVIPVQAVRE
jgi:signal transduction histidine kinase/PAS domain-containing protein